MGKESRTRLRAGQPQVNLVTKPAYSATLSSIWLTIISDADIAQVGKTIIHLWVDNITTEIFSMSLGNLSNVEDFFIKVSTHCAVAIEKIASVTILLPVNLAIPVAQVELEHLILPVENGDNSAFVVLLYLLFRAVGKPLPPGMLPRIFSLSASVLTLDNQNKGNIEDIDMDPELLIRLGRPRKTVAACGSSWEYAFTLTKLCLPPEILRTKRERKLPKRFEGFISGARALEVVSYCLDVEEEDLPSN
jgi:hypothetical protein